jgi:hypothetical protein
MIPLIGTGKVKHMGMMRRVTMSGPIVPEISPGIQGMGAYDLLTDEQKGLLRYALKDAAKCYKCDWKELRWSFGAKKGGVAPLRIWKPVKYDLRTKKSG